MPALLVGYALQRQRRVHHRYLCRRLSARRSRNSVRQQQRLRYRGMQRRCLSDRRHWRPMRQQRRLRHRQLQLGNVSARGRQHALRVERGLHSWRLLRSKRRAQDLRWARVHLRWERWMHLRQLQRRWRMRRSVCRVFDDHSLLSDAALYVPRLPRDLATLDARRRPPGVHSASLGGSDSVRLGQTASDPISPRGRGRSPGGCSHRARPPAPARTAR